MKQQTAVEWLIEKINSHDSHDAVILNEKYFSESKLLKYLQVAKEMEKEQIKEANNYGWDDRHQELNKIWDDDADENYYNETYGQ